MTADLRSKQFDTDNQLQLAIGDLVKENMASKMQGLDLLTNILGIKKGTSLAQQQMGMDMNQFTQSLEHDEAMKRLMNSWQVSRDQMQHYYQLYSMWYGGQIQKDLNDDWTPSDWINLGRGVGQGVGMAFGGGGG